MVIVVLALAAVLSALSGGYLCVPRPAQRPGRRSAPVVELATRPHRSSTLLLRLGERAAALDAARTRALAVARAGRTSPPRTEPSSPLGAALEQDRPGPLAAPLAAPLAYESWLTASSLPTGGGPDRRPVRRGPYGASPVRGSLITLDDQADLDFRFRSVAMASSVVAPGDHLDAVRMTGLDGRIHVPAEEHGRVAFGVLTVGD